MEVAIKDNQWSGTTRPQTPRGQQRETVVSGSFTGANLGNLLRSLQ